jgi:regulatory protein
LRARSSAEVASHLRRLGGTIAVVESTLEKLRRLNYINDRAFARNWALSRAQNQGYGPRRIDQELKKKGVIDAVIREALKEIFEQENEEERARKILQKRFAGANFQEPRALRRAVAFLQRRGYSSKVIFELLRCSVDDNC